MPPSRDAPSKNFRKTVSRCSSNELTTENAEVSQRLSENNISRFQAGITDVAEVVRPQFSGELRPSSRSREVTAHLSV